jgi:hypothetical protein
MLTTACPFQEAKTGHVGLAEDCPITFGMLLEYIYTVVFAIPPIATVRSQSCTSLRAAPGRRRELRC